MQQNENCPWYQADLQAERERIPAEPLKMGRGRTARYPWTTVEVGETFVADTESIRTQAWLASKKYGRQFKVTKHGQFYDVTRIT